MKRLFPTIAVIIVLALTGCTGQAASSDGKEQIVDRADPNLNGNMMDIVLSPTDARAGENITANLVVGNTGSKDINSETIEIKIKPISIDDFFANIAILLMSEGKKTLTFPNEYKEVIKPGMIKPFTVVFPTPRELRGSNLAGTYNLTITLSVNGQAVQSKSQQLKLRSGKPRVSSNAQNSTSANLATTAPTTAVTANAAPAVTTPNPTPTPTPAPTPQAVTVDTHLFAWGEVPGKDEAKLREFLKNRYAVDWVGTATLEKSDSLGVINFTSDNNLISLQLDEYKTKLSVLINENKKDEFQGMMVDGKLNIYTGKLKFTRIKDWTFSESTITIDAGDWVQWQNLWDDEFEFTLKETNGKMSNITVRNRRDIYFDTTGTYNFELFFPKMRVAPPVQVINVKLNQSQ